MKYTFILVLHVVWSIQLSCSWVDSKLANFLFYQDGTIDNGVSTGARLAQNKSVKNYLLDPNISRFANWTMQVVNETDLDPDDTVNQSDYSANNSNVTDKIITFKPQRMNVEDILNNVTKEVFRELAQEHTILQIEEDGDVHDDGNADEGDNQEDNNDNHNEDEDAHNDDNIDDTENTNEEEDDEDPDDDDSNEESLLMKVTKRILSSLSRTCPQLNATVASGSNLLFYKSVKLHFGYDLCTQIEEWFNRLNMKFEKDEIEFRKNIMTLFSLHDNYKELDNGKEFIDFWRNKKHELAAKVEMFSSMYPDQMANGFGSAMLQFLLDWNANTEYLINRLDMIKQAALKKEEIVISTEAAAKKANENNAVDLLKSIEKKIEEISQMEKFK